MLEVERKRTLTSTGIARLVGRLHELGYRRHGDHVEVDDYYSRPDVDFMSTVECLRVRRRDGFAEITYKPSSTAATSSVTGTVAKQETNVTLGTPDQADMANQLLDMLGMRHLVRVNKRRSEYRHDLEPRSTIAMDSIAGAGAFVEVEVFSADADDGEATLTRLEDQLGIAEFPVTTLPYRDLVMRGIGG